MICRRLEDVLRGKINRLLIAAPPGSAKSTYSSHMAPAWILGQRPDLLVISASHTAEFAEGWGLKVRNTINSQTYQRIFPHTKISPDTRSKGNWGTTKGGAYFAVGVGGSVTGRRADLLIIDDPFRGRQDADSAARRKQVFEWYQADAFTRLKPGAAVILIATRWHEDDLTGRLLEMSNTGEGDKWHTLELQAICEDPANDPLGRAYGEALWPQWQDEAALAGIRKNVSIREWEALYQQRPKPLEGGLVNREWFRSYKTPPTDLKITLSLDTGSTATERSDPSVVTVWGKSPQRDHYLLDMWRDHVEFTELIANIMRLARRYNPMAILVENKGAGTQVIQTIGKGFTDYNVIAINPSRATGGKEFRFDLVTPYFENGKVLIPETQTKWVEDFVDEILTFPNGAHDDIVDSCSQYLAWAAPRARRGMAHLRG